MTDFALVVGGMALVTYVPRWLPLFLLARRRLPEWFIQWLDLIPAAILSALIVPELFTAGDPRHLELVQIKSLTALPVLVIAVKTRSLGGTVVAGMFLFWLAGKLF